MLPLRCEYRAARPGRYVRAGIESGQSSDPFPVISPV